MIKMTVRTRFAPSPTGFMHVGNLRTALYAYLLAKSNNGVFVLRIEDTDQARYVEGATQVIFNTLKTAGLIHDEGPDKDGGCGPYIQSQRKPLYRKYAELLVEKGAAYYSFETGTAAATAAANGETQEEDDGLEPEFDLERAKAKIAAGIPHVIRQRIDKSGSSTFTDSVFGEITIENKVLDDQILLKSDGMPTYNFANVIDDHLMNITHVVRGAEYLPSTPKYNLLYRAFGWDIPVYVHLPLIMGRNSDGSVAKLSKRHGSVSFENLISEGYLPAAIINYIALLGWSPKNDREIFSLEELVANFSVSGLNKAPAVFDYAKLAWMNGEYVKALPFDDFVRLAEPFACLEGTPLAEKWELIAKLLHQRTEVLSEIPGKIHFLLELPEYENELFFNKKCKSTPELAATMLPEILELIRNVAPWNAETLNGVISAYAAERNMKLNLATWAPRIAVAGQSVTPGGAFELMEILGRDESLRRIGVAIEKLKRG
ncbi:MAG: glutamate--tRNA ligase [Victivallaceae bacterium]|nr:glutamate--tRNA ligase [Victivallaceae bacterium]